jgi:hypothetical protein
MPSLLERPELFAKLLNPASQTTPAEITEVIREICTKVSSHEPVFVPVRPGEGCEKRDCHRNVPQVIESHGGDMVTGWIVWETPGFGLEFEFHAIWQSPDGDWCDVTPQADGETQILFLPDPEKQFDFTGETLHYNRCFPLSDDPDVVQLVAYQQQFVERQMRVSTEIRLGKKPPSAYADLFRAMLTETIPDHLPAPLDDLLSRQSPRTGRNDPCYCGSGKKFKKCCMD